MTELLPGAVVVVHDDWPEVQGPVHVRTPHYVRGRRGRIVKALGLFPDPGDLAFRRTPVMRRLYHVAFSLDGLWEGAGPDELLVELYEHWLMAA